MSAQPEKFDQRNYPRVHLFRPLKLTFENGVSIKANLRDLSSSGLQAVTHLDATQGLGEKSAQTLITARFNLPVDNEFFDIAIQCKLVHLSEVPDEGVAIGLSFTHCRETDIGHLNQFILCSLETA